MGAANWIRQQARKKKAQAAATNVSAMPATTSPVTATVAPAPASAMPTFTGTTPAVAASNAVTPTQTAAPVRASAPLTVTPSVTATAPVTGTTPPASLPRPGAVPMSVGVNRGLYLPAGIVTGGEMATANPAKATTSTTRATAPSVPRERWIRDMTAQRQGPLPSGQTPGMVPYVGPYPNATQRVPDALDPTTKRYTPGSPAEYQTWLDGRAFGAKANANTDIPRFSGMTPTDLEMANVRRAQSGAGTLSPLPLSPSVLQSVQQTDTAQRKAWGEALDYEDAADRAKKRAASAGPARVIAGAAQSVYDTLAKGARAMKADRSYDAVETVRLNRGAPRDNLSPAATMPPYTGPTTGGGGGGGWGGGDSGPRRWLQNMASWRI